MKAASIQQTVIALLAACGLAGTAQAALITNGDFETGNFTGWSAVGGVFNINPATDLGGPTLPANGSHVVDFGGGGATGGLLEQTIATEVGRTYVLSFEYGGFQAGEFGQPQLLQVLIDQVGIDTVGDSTGGHDLTDLFKSYSFSFVAAGASTVIGFLDVSPTGDSADGLLDNVTVEVPEPASLALAGLALAGLAAARRKRI